MLRDTFVMRSQMMEKASNQAGTSLDYRVYCLLYTEGVTVFPYGAVMKYGFPVAFYVCERHKYLLKKDVELVLLYIYRRNNSLFASSLCSEICCFCEFNKHRVYYELTFWILLHYFIYSHTRALHIEILFTHSFEHEAQFSLHTPTL